MLYSGLKLALRQNYQEKVWRTTTKLLWRAANNWGISFQSGTEVGPECRLNVGRISPGQGTGETVW